MRWGWKEGVGAQEQRGSGSCSPVKAAFEAGGQKGQTCQVSGSGGKLTGRWAVSPIAVNPSGHLIWVYDCTYSLARGIEGPQIVSHWL